MNLVDVTLRDGGHAIKWLWPLNFTQEYYRVISQISEVNFIELGYWKQTKKSDSPHYNLNMDYVSKITQDAKKKNVCVMIDYHYCKHDIKEYPKIDEQEDVGMIRLCSRKQDYNNALKFLLDLKNYTGLETSLNVFNISNYSHDEIISVSKYLSSYDLDYVTFADTHGCLNLKKDFKTFAEATKILNDSGIKTGMHLHDHSGQAYMNYNILPDIGFESTDASTRGMGKGVGNLKLEHIIGRSSLRQLMNFTSKNLELLTMKESPWALVTARYSIVDYYGYNAEKLGIDILQFDDFCQTVSGVDKDVYNHDILLSYFKIPKNEIYR